MNTLWDLSGETTWWHRIKLYSVIGSQYVVNVQPD